MNYRNRALLDACYQIPCTADWPHDCGPTEPSHSNQGKHGKGKSLKAHDCFVASLCRNSHRELDQGKLFNREDKFAYWQRAFEKTLLEMWRRGLIGVVPEQQRAVDAVRSAFSNSRMGDGPAVALVTDAAYQHLSRPPRRKRATLTKHQNGYSTESPSKIFRRP